MVCTKVRSVEIQIENVDIYHVWLQKTIPEVSSAIVSLLSTLAGPGRVDSVKPVNTVRFGLLTDDWTRESLIEDSQLFFQKLK